MLFHYIPNAETNYYSYVTKPTILLLTGNVQVTSGERSVTFSWPPPSIVPVEKITGYNISCSPLPTSLPLSFSESGTHTVWGFSPNTTYNCSLETYSGQQMIQTVSLVITTKEDSKFQSFAGIIFSLQNNYLEISRPYLGRILVGARRRQFLMAKFSLP